MRIILVILAIFAVLFCAFAMYAAIVVGSQFDRRMEELFGQEERKGDADDKP